MAIPLMLVGSVPLTDAETVFTASSRYLGERLARFPDGETGVRRNWIAWQFPVFAAMRTLEQTGTRAREYQLHPPFRIRDGYRVTDLRFPALGFAREAKASYAGFRRMRSEGLVHAKARFMVALPTPWAPVYSYITYEDQHAVQPVYERVLMKELAEILATIPHDELAIQWDVATEMSWLEQVYPPPFESGVDDQVFAELTRLGAAVPADVQLGYHLCYGSMNNRHWKEPEDMSLLVRVANRLFAEVSRPIHFVHMPVPMNRDDDAYFAALKQLTLPGHCQLYLGLLHLDDGVDGAIRRLTTARRVRTDFGIACECGLGRRPTEVAQAWLALHEQVALAAESTFPDIASA